MSTQIKLLSLCSYFIGVLILSSVLLYLLGIDLIVGAALWRSFHITSILFAVFFSILGFLISSERYGAEVIIRLTFSLFSLLTFTPALKIFSGQESFAVTFLVDATSQAAVVSVSMFTTVILLSLIYTGFVRRHWDISLVHSFIENFCNPLRKFWNQHFLLYRDTTDEWQEEEDRKANTLTDSVRVEQYSKVEGEKDTLTHPASVAPLVFREPLDVAVGDDLDPVDDDQALTPDEFPDTSDHKITHWGDGASLLARTSLIDEEASREEEFETSRLREPLDVVFGEELLPVNEDLSSEVGEYPEASPEENSSRKTLQESFEFDIEKEIDPGYLIHTQEDKEGKQRSDQMWDNYSLPSAERILQKKGTDTTIGEIDESTKRMADILRNTLKEFKISAEVTGIEKGPVVTMFAILPAPGVKLSRIVNLSDNLALRLAASSVRIVAPIPGKHAVGIEVPNKKRTNVYFNDVTSSKEMEKAKEKCAIPVALGKDIGGKNQILDIAKTPHLLIAGATGAGKSVCVNSIICSILFTRSPKEVQLMMIDPKIVELKLYNDIPHLLTPVITDPKKALQAVNWCLCEMERRYALLEALGVRNIKSFNSKARTSGMTVSALSYIVLIIDEFADLMATSGKEMESIVARLAAMSRAVGIHLVLATQRPSIDVITGLIKANFPSRIAFMVASKTDSRIIIDSVGAEQLLGQGDMLFTAGWNPFPCRIQGAFLSEEEAEKTAEYVKTLGKPDYIDDEIFLDDEEELSEDFGGGEDPLFDKALEIVIHSGKASASYLQRKLKVGYNRAARLVEIMEARGIVGPQNGSKPREILHVPS